MEIAKNLSWIIPYKKFSKLRVNIKHTDFTGTSIQNMFTVHFQTTYLKIIKPYIIQMCMLHRIPCLLLNISIQYIFCVPVL